MHADFHELSDVAAGRREASGHVRACGECRVRLVEVKAVQAGLRALDPLVPPAAGWVGARSRLERRAEIKAQKPTPLAYAMAASLLAVAFAAMLLLNTIDV